MKFGICNEIFQDWKLEDAMRFARQAGYDGIEVAPFTLAASVTAIASAERKRIRQAAADAGIAVAGIHWVLAKTEGLYVNHPDPVVRHRTARYLCELVDFCADISGSIMVVGSPKQRDVMPGVSFQQAWDWATGTFQDSVQRAEQQGVTICFEPLAPVETNFINTAAEAIRFAQQFDSPRFQIILDVKAMSSESKPIPQIIRDSWPKFAHVHANDVNFKGPGSGDVDFAPIAAALKEVGYDGYVSVEVFDFEEGAKAIATRSIDYLRRVFI
jgi:sugar phosphate isomerase/epimerase